MSLINDALKRAKEAQDKPEQGPPPDLKFRTVDATEAASSRPAWLLPSLITAAVLTTVFVVWEFAHSAHQQKSAPAAEQSSSTSLKVHAREQDVAVLPKGLG